MRLRYPDYYENFKCLGGDCPSTCCTGWVIEIDGSTRKKYRRLRRNKHVSNDFKMQLSYGIDWKNSCLNTRDGHCVFLDEKGLCILHANLGEKQLCRTCRLYPRHREDYGSLCEIMLNMSCPEAARLILTAKAPAHFKIRTRHRGTGRFIRRRKHQALEQWLLICLENVREIMFEILLDRRISLKFRIAAIMLMADDIQKYLNRVILRRKGSQEAAIRIVTIGEKYKKYMVSPGVEAKVLACKTEPGSGVLLMIQYLDMLQGLLNTTGDDLMNHYMNDAIQLYISDPSRAKLNADLEQKAELTSAFECFMIYQLYTTMLGAIYDGDLLSKVKLAVYSYLVVRELCLATHLKNDRLTLDDLIEIAYHFARQIEHSDYNLEAVENMLAEHEIFQTNRMLACVIE